MDNIPNSISHLFSLEGKFAVITGGGGHLCSAIAGGLAMAGASIAVIDVREEKALKVANEIKNKYEVNAIPIKADVTDETSLKNALDQILKEFSTLDILINGAGKNSPKPFLDISLEEWHEVMNSQITGTMLGCKIFAPEMIKNKKGSIINISSASAGPPLSKAFA